MLKWRHITEHGVAAIPSTTEWIRPSICSLFRYCMTGRKQPTHHMKRRLAVNPIKCRALQCIRRFHSLFHSLLDQVYLRRGFRQAVNYLRATRSHKALFNVPLQYLFTIGLSCLLRWSVLSHVECQRCRRIARYLTWQVGLEQLYLAFDRHYDRPSRWSLNQRYSSSVYELFEIGRLHNHYYPRCGVIV